MIPHSPAEVGKNSVSPRTVHKPYRSAVLVYGTHQRYGWLRSEIASAVCGLALLLATSYGFLWSLGRSWFLTAVCGVLMFVGAAVASTSVPDGTTMRDSISYLEGLHRHVWADQNWSDVRMEDEFLRALRTVDPASVVGGQKAINRRLRL